MKVLFPAPGTPVMPTRRESPASGRHALQDLRGEFGVALKFTLDNGDGTRQNHTLAFEHALDVSLGREAAAARRRPKWF